MSSPRAIARILAAREAPLAGAGGICPLDTIFIESLLLLSSDCCWRKSEITTACCVIKTKVKKRRRSRFYF